MPFGPEFVLGGDLSQNLFDVGMLKLNHRLALIADEMFMLRVAVIVVVNRSRADFDLLQQARLHQFAE